MGLSASYVAVSDDELSSLERLDPDAVASAVADAMWTRWADNPSAGIETQWHGLHFVLTGRDDSTSISGVPLSEAVLGTFDFDTGSGAYATIVTAARVPELLGALRAVDREALVDGFEPARLAERDIYPATIWLRDSPKALVLALLDALDTLTTFYEAAHSRGLGVLVQVL